MPAVRVFAGSLTNSFGLTCRDHTSDKNIFMYATFSQSLRFWFVAVIFNLGVVLLFSRDARSFCCDRKRPSSMCAKLRNVAASSKFDRPTRSLYYCLFAPHIRSVFLRAHSVRGEPRISAQRQQSGCNVSDKYIHNYFHILYFVHRTTFCRSQKNRNTWQ